MKKRFFFVFAILFVALACVTFSACGQTEKDSNEGVENISAVTEDQEVSANYSYDYDNWYEFGKNNPVEISQYSRVNDIKIDTAEKLARFLFLVNDNWGLTGTSYKWRNLDVYITADIDMSRLNWVPLGTNDNPYTGDFYGQNHYISGLNITGENNDNALVGFFGKVTGYIEDITVDVYIDSVCEGGSKVGGLAAYSEYCWFTNCAVRGTIKYLPEKNRGWWWYNNDHVGGIVGYCGDKSVYITNCVNYATITRKDDRSHSTSCIGGIVGYGQKCYINSCLNLGAIDKKGSNFAGIAGKLEGGTINYCSDYGNVSKPQSEFSHIHGYSTSNVIVRDCAYGDTSASDRNCTENATETVNSGPISITYYHDEFVDNMTETYSCQVNGDFVAWGKDVEGIQVPSALLYKFNISFGWNSKNNSGSFNSTSNAVCMKKIENEYFWDYKTISILGISIKIPFLNKREVELDGEYFNTYSYEYVLGAKPNLEFKFKINNTEMFSLSDVNVDPSNYFTLNSSTGKLVYKNKVLMRMTEDSYSSSESRERDIKFTFKSKLKTLTIEATNCRGKTNGNKYTTTRDLYYHDNLCVEIKPSDYYTANTSEDSIYTNSNQNNEGYKPAWDGSYLTLSYYTGQDKIRISASATKYSYNVVFTDRVNKNFSSVNTGSYNYSTYTYNYFTEIYKYGENNDYNTYHNRLNFGFTYYVKVGDDDPYKIENSNICKAISERHSEYYDDEEDLEWYSLSLCFNLNAFLNSRERGFSFVVGKDVTVYVNYGYTGDNLLAVSPGEDYYLPFTTTINNTNFTKDNNISELCTAIGKQLDVGYKVHVNNSQDQSTKITTTTIKVTDEFTENGAQGCYFGAGNIFSFTCTSYEGYKFKEVTGVDDKDKKVVKVVKNGKVSVDPITLKFSVTGFTITHDNTEFVSIYRDQYNNIINPSQKGWYEKVGDTNTFVKTTDKIWIKGRKNYYQNGNQVDANKYYSTGNNGAVYHSLIVIAAIPQDGEKCVGITCNGKIVTVESYYLFVVDPELEKDKIKLYIQTNDTEVDSKKTYYSYNSNTGEYVKVSTPTGDPQANGWYEYKPFELSFDAIYVDDVSYDSNQISEPTQTATNHYVISSVANLRWLAMQVNSGETFENYTFVQTADLNFSDENYIPIGNENNAFKGTYDGGNHSISNIVFSDDNLNLDENGFVGLFGNVESATIKNLTIKNSSFVGNRYVGAFVGKAKNSTFYNLNAYNCTVTVKEFEYYDIYGTLQTGKQKTYQDSINNLEVTQTIYTEDRIGFAGVVGNAYKCSFTGVAYKDGKIEFSLVSPKTQIDSAYIGAITGSHASNNSMTSCYAEADLTSLFAASAASDFSDYYYILGDASNNENVYVRNTENTQQASYRITLKDGTTKVKSSYSSLDSDWQNVDDTVWMILNGKPVLKFFYWAV